MQPRRKYSQNDEEPLILSWFGDRRGTFLDIGAGHPTSFSNIRALWERGWNGVLVEPAEWLQPLLAASYGVRPGVQIIQAAVGAYTGEAPFREARDLVSTTISSETQKWTDSLNIRFERRTIQQYTLADLLARCDYDRFDFVNIDTEGNVEDILAQLDPHALGASLVCVEWASKNREFYETWAERWGMAKLMENAENMIFGRS